MPLRAALRFARAARRVPAAPRAAGAPPRARGAAAGTRTVSTVSASHRLRALRGARRHSIVYVCTGYGSTAFPTFRPQLSSTTPYLSLNCATRYNVQRTVQVQYLGGFPVTRRVSLRASRAVACAPPSTTPRPCHQERPNHETDHTPGRWRCAWGSPTVLARPRRARLVPRAPRQPHSLVVGL